MSTRVSHPLLRYLMFFVLTLAISLPTTALAAPAVQPGTTAAEAELLAYYESDVIADEADNEVVIGLSFYDDNTFEMSLDYLDGEDPNVGTGDYEETDDGVLLTIYAGDGEELDEPVELELVFNADDALVIVGSPDGPMGEEDIILYPLDPAADSGAEDTDEMMLEVGGVYISPVQPSDSSDGVVYMLNLLPNGDASLNSDYLNLEPPVFELGTWADNGDGTVTLEVLGTVEEDYDDPIVIDFAIGASGELMLDELSLYPLMLLSQVGVDDSEAGNEIGNAESDVYVYVAEVIVDGEDAPFYVYMLIYDDGTVILTDDEESTTLYGEWTFEDEVLYVSITSDDETEFEEAAELVFEFDEEGALVATDYPVDVFGEDGLIFYPADEGDEKSVAEGEFYYYESDQLPSEETDGIIISLILGADGGALVSTDWMNEDEPYLEYGEWTRDEDGAVIVSITEGPDGAYDEPLVFTFEEDADDLSLVLSDESTEIFGDAGLVLYRIE